MAVALYCYVRVRQNVVPAIGVSQVAPEEQSLHQERSTNSDLMEVHKSLLEHVETQLLERSEEALQQLPQRCEFTSS
jgi:hypothetical protein